MYPSIILKHVVMLWPRVEKSTMAELRGGHVITVIRAYGKRLVPPQKEARE